MSKPRPRAVPPDVRLAIYRASRLAPERALKCLAHEYGYSLRTIRDCVNNETRARALMTKERP